MWLEICSYQSQRGRRRSTLVKSQCLSQSCETQTGSLTASQADGTNLKTRTAQEAVLHRGKIFGLGHFVGDSRVVRGKGGGRSRSKVEASASPQVMRRAASTLLIVPLVRPPRVQKRRSIGAPCPWPMSKGQRGAQPMPLTVTDTAAAVESPISNGQAHGSGAAGINPAIQVHDPRVLSPASHVANGPIPR